MKMTEQRFTMKMHCCGSNDVEEAELRLELCDGGGGDYLVMHATHWAFDSDEEIDALCNKLKAMNPKKPTP